MSRSAFGALAVWLWAGAAFAVGTTSLDGTSRISLLPGWRYTTNQSFSSQAQAAGTPVQGASVGGPQFTASFGYSGADYAEVFIDLFAGGERFDLEGRGTLTSVTYGANVGLRLQWLLAERWVPAVGASTGPTLVYVRGAGLEKPEEVMKNGYACMVSSLFRVTESWGVQLDARFLMARGRVGTLQSINGGGLWVGLGVTYTLPRAPNAPPGF